MRENNKEICGAFNYFENFLVFVSAFSTCVLILGFASLVGVTVGTARFVVGLKLCVIIARIKLHKSIIK